MWTNSTAPFAPRLARDRSDIDADTFQDRFALDDQDPFSQPRTLNSGVMARRPKPMATKS
jgi:hypothetical protein